jgi:serine/threonine protein kinase
MTEELLLPYQLGRFTLLRPLGRGGMGVVYVARDERLDRDVAVKMIAGLSDESSVKRFWREARAAASVSHPNVCQIYEVDEHAAGIYLAMELLEGESLETRLKRGVCPPAEALRIERDLLAALSALHDRGLVHRDIKPANVFLTQHGAKVLDFGLARSIIENTAIIGAPNSGAITQPGMIVGTPSYMSPEQISGDELDARTDIYSSGAVLFEMLAARPPFIGHGILEIAHAVLHEHPPALQGTAAIVAIDRVIRRALAKDPSNRYATAAAMRADLAAIAAPEGATERATPVRTLLRLIVPPLRLLRDEPALSFLSFGLAEAVSGSLSALPDVVVRAPSLAAKTGDAEVDPRRLATTADVDMVILGSLLSSGDQIRATIQLVEAGSGTVLGSRSTRGDVSDIFALEDELCQAVLALLQPHRHGADDITQVRAAPAKGKAFEYFLRGIEHARELTGMKAAREWFEKAVEDDPLFAPAWAWLGRAHRVIGKYEEDRDANMRRAEEAFSRALALSPDLPVAHRYLTHLEAEGGRADAAVARLLTHAKVNRNDAQLFAALVHACRYAGLNAASLAAHEEARRLDPTVPTSFEFTLLMSGNFDRIRSLRGQPNVEQTAISYVILFDREDEVGVAALRAIDADRLPSGFRLTVKAVQAAFAIPPDPNALRALDDAIGLGSANGPQGDPEAVLFYAFVAARLKDRERALTLIERSVGGGFAPVHILETAPALDFIRGDPRFTAAIETARRRREVAAAIFERNGGGTLLGLAPGTA